MSGASEQAPAKQTLVVLFPGFGYGPDKPLLYYAARVARQKGDRVLDVQYSTLSLDEPTPQQCAEQSLPGALADAEMQIPAGYARYILVAKSFGTLVAGLWAKGHPGCRVELIQLTPLPLGYDTVYKGVPAFMVTGTADPLSTPEFRRRLVEDPALEVLLVQGGNHSLDTPPDYTAGVEALRGIVQKYQQLF